MIKPKVELYNLDISLLLWLTDLKVYWSNLLVNVYVSTKFERRSMTNNREIAERSFVQFCLLVPLTLDLRTWKCIPLMYKLLSIYTSQVWKRFVEKWQRNDKMIKPKVEFYNLDISLLLWPTDLKVYWSNLLVDVYVSTKFERRSMTNNREIAERSFVPFCLLLPLTVDLRTWKCIQLMYKLLSIYKPSLKQIRRKMTEKW